MAVPRICSIDGCGKSHSAKGYCGKHYDRWRKHGHPTGGKTDRGAAWKFLQEVVLPFKGADCLYWPFIRTKKGYARVGVNGQMQSVHRLACEAIHGKPPTPYHQAAHNCGQGHNGCCNPQHMRWATAKENSDDKKAHGTARCLLSDEQIRDILSRQNDRANDLASEFGVSVSKIYSLRKG